MARKLKNHLRSGPTGKIDFTLRINLLIGFFRREKRNLTYVQWRRKGRVRKKEKPPDVHFLVWDENQSWWDRQLDLFSKKEGGREIPANRILDSLLIEGVPLLLKELDSSGR